MDVVGSIDKFEDIIAWQKARNLTKAIYAVSSRGEFARDSVDFVIPFTGNLLNTPEFLALRT
jgi:hypothetical protein